MLTKTKMEIERLGSALGAQVHGVDLRETPSADLAADLRAALDQHQVLVLRGQDGMTAEQQIAVASLFGFPGCSEPWRSIALLDDGVTEPAVLQDVPANRWHSDMSFTPRPTVVGTLSAIVIPEVGGDTAFVSTAAIYDALSEHLKAMCEPLMGEHTMWHGGGDAWMANEPRAHIERCKRLLPPMLHPLVQTHPGSGRKYIYNGGFWMTGLRDPVDPNSPIAANLHTLEKEMLHAFLNKQLDNVEYQFRWRWGPGDLIIWDERCTNHMAVHPHGGLRRVVRSVWAWPDNEPARLEH